MPSNLHQILALRALASAGSPFWAIIDEYPKDIK
jgi:hypothetical protein